ncbi:MAG TPA: sulfurtransferase [Candidatus Binataceae bacterium]|nr:sulfurtransferase [Candidatus Binataceae bacterium]
MKTKSVHTNGTTQFLADARWLGRHLDDPTVIPIDTRPAKDYWAGHLRGARHFDPFPFHYYDTSERGIAEFGAQIEWIFSALGVTGNETVVFYENESGMRAARGVWCLEYAGHPKVRMLDGGLKALKREKLVTAALKFSPTEFKIKPQVEIIAGFARVLEKIGKPDAQIFDVRTDEEYFGERVRAKHGGAIPGAIHQDWVAALAPSGLVKPAAELREQFQALGLDPKREIITYCQGGYRAAHAYIALKRAGYPNVRNYLASWAEWGNRDDLPRENPKRPG